jgi:LacI family transcriptional regulator
MAAQLRATGVPLIEMLGHRPEQPAKVHADNASAGRLAAEHLLERGLRNFGFFAYGEAWWIDKYREGFQKTLQLHRFVCDVYRPPRFNACIWPKWRESMQPGVVAWLQSLPKPAGVFAPAIEYAGMVLSQCRNLDMAVPEEIAVLASVDDPPLCNLFTPPLSCVDLPAERIGYEAAAMLDRSMAGEKPPQQTLWIPATYVVERESTNLVAIADADVAGALRFIREQACQGIGVSEIVDHMGLSRRMLELKFYRYLGRTPKEEILKIKLDRAQLLLNRSELSIETIARKSGFPSFKNFAILFRRKLGVTPRAFRKTHRIWREGMVKGGADRAL